MARQRPEQRRSWQIVLWTGLLAVGLIAASGKSVAQRTADAPQALPTIPLQAGFHNITAQVAQTPEQRQIGLMHRKTMPVHEGMLFVFEAPAVQCFWMKNTLLPLSIAFLADDGSIVNLDEMKPQTLESHCSKKPVRYVLEMNTGWFTKRGLKAGDRITGAPFNQTRR